ncbi:hypothetical protein F2Q70_00031766 [Brassica cretica]|uniref:Uncharacterized protein n=1 Tax=Brassica cretica TaxID=69181 RepID=A0A8S9FIU2_BRACR|nr:hypothetical protein F2Q70_00031766 [Brassica cretica]
MSVCFCSGRMGFMGVVSVAFSEKSLITIVGILERGRYEMISGNMGLYLRQWRVLKLISMLGSNTLEKEDGEGLIRRLRDNRKERFREGVRIWIVIHLALIHCYNNNGEIFDWDETTTVLRAGCDDTVRVFWLHNVLHCFRRYFYGIYGEMLG